MTTRKALIEKIQSMQLGTQEMLDAAAEDARLIPFDTLFVDAFGSATWRTPGNHSLNDAGSVAFCSWPDGCRFSGALELRPMTEE